MESLNLDILIMFKTEMVSKCVTNQEKCESFRKMMPEKNIRH